MQADEYYYQKFIHSGRKKAHSQEWFLKKCQYLGPDYVLINSYKSLQDKVVFYHKKCGHYWTTYAVEIIYRHSHCSWCRNHRGINHLQVFCDKHGLEILSPWKKHHGIMTFRGKKCGHVFQRRPNNLYRWWKCPYCNGYRQKGNVSCLGQKLYKLRHERHWTQKELAALFKVSPKTISNLERGYVQPTKEQISRFNYYLKAIGWE